jgi:hypothetical protein
MLIRNIIQMISKVKASHRTRLRKLSKNTNFKIKKIVLTVVRMVKLQVLNCKTSPILSRSREVSNNTRSWSIELLEECRASTSATLVPLVD